MRCVIAAAAVLALSVPAWADVHVTISKSQQQMAVSIDGGPSYRWAVSTGKPGYDTPSGSFSAIRLERVYFSKKYDDAPMPNAVFFHGGFAIHGTLEERRLGRPVSHGCVRLMRANAEVLFEAVRAQGMSRTHIVITDSPLYGGSPVADSYDRRFDGPRGYVERGMSRGNYDDGGYSPARSVVYRDDRYYERNNGIARGRSYDDRRAPRAPSFVDLSKRSYHGEPQRPVIDLAPRDRDARSEGRSPALMLLEPGRRYSEAEVRRIYRENRW